MHNNLGKALEKKGQWNQAMAAYQTAIAQRSDFFAGTLQHEAFSCCSKAISSKGGPNANGVGRQMSSVSSAGIGQPRNGTEANCPATEFWCMPSKGLVIRSSSFDTRGWLPNVAGKIILECQPELLRLFARTTGS